MYLPTSPRQRPPKNRLLLARMALAGLTPRGLAAAVGRHPNCIYRLLNMRAEPTPQTLQRLCAVLHATPTQLGLED